MAVKQISVLLGNIPGTLSRLTNILDKEDITAKALLSASAAESSTVRMRRAFGWPMKSLRELGRVGFIVILPLVV